MIDHPLIVAHDGPIDPGRLEDAIEQARRVHEALAMVTRRFVPSTGNVLGEQHEWRPVRGMRVMSHSIVATGKRIYAVETSNGRRSGIVLPQSRSNANALRSLARGMRLGTSAGRRGEGRGHALAAEEAVTCALHVLEAARERGVFDVVRARAMIAADAIAQDIRNRAREPFELRIVAPTPWTDAALYNRSAKKRTWDGSTSVASDATGIVWAVAIDLCDHAPVLTQVSSEPYPADPTPMEILRLHARASGADA